MMGGGEDGMEGAMGYEALGRYGVMGEHGMRNRTWMNDASEVW